jgi:Flp pilus assembly protein TadD
MAAVAVGRADGPEDQYVQIFSLIQEADGLSGAGQARQALERYAEAQAELAKFHTLYPGWNEQLIRYRLGYVNAKLAPLVAQLPPVTNAVAAASTGERATVPANPSGALTNSLVREFQEEVQRLQADNASLAAKLKEALSVQPSKVDPHEVAKAEEKNRALQKENDLLKVSLHQEQERVSQLVEPDVLTQANRTLADTKRKLESQEQTLGALRAENAVLQKKAEEAGARKPEADAQLSSQLQQSRDGLAALQTEHEKLRSEKTLLESRLKELESSQAAKGAREARVKELEANLAKANSAAEQEAKAKAQAVKQAQEELDRQAATARAAAKETENRLAQLEKENEKLAKEKADLEARLAKAARKAPAASGDEGLKTALKESQQRADRYEREVARMTKEKFDLETKLGAAVEEATRAEAKKRSAVEDQVADLQAKLEKAQKQLSKRGTSKAATADLQQQVERMQAKLAVLEAKPEPYTAEELAMLRAPSARLVASASQGGASSPPTATATTTAADTLPVTGTNPPARVKRTAAQLPPGAGAMDAAAQKAFAAGHFEEAAQKYLEIMRQDEKNVYVLGNLASTEIELNKLDEADKHLTTALQVDPEDDYCLYLRGRIAYKRGKIDQALDLLSQAAKLNPSSAETQNHLGMVLAEKGLRAQAEAAFRKAIQLHPGYAQAHGNLAFVYATQKPPSLALARWHYQKAVAAGLPKNPELEKILGL